MRYEITDPDSGVTVELEGDGEPTEAELEEIFATVSKPAAPQFSLDYAPAPIPRSGLERAAMDEASLGPLRQSIVPPPTREQQVMEETWETLSPGERALSDISRLGRGAVSGVGKGIEGVGTFEELTNPPPPMGSVDARQAEMRAMMANARSPEMRESLRSQFGELEPQRAAESPEARLAANPLVQQGRSITAGGERAFPTIQPESVDRPLGAVLEGVGSSAPILLAGVATGGAGVIPAAAAMEFQDAFDRELTRQQRSGETPDYTKALYKSSGYAAVSSAIEQRLGVGRLIRNAGKRFGADAEKELARALATQSPREAIKDFTARRLKDIGPNALDEGLQRLSQDMIVEGKPEWGAIFQEAAIGGVAGPLTGAVLDAPGTAVQMLPQDQSALQGAPLNQPAPVTPNLPLLSQEEVEESRGREGVLSIMEKYQVDRDTAVEMLSRAKTVHGMIKTPDQSQSTQEAPLAQPAAEPTTKSESVSGSLVQPTEAAPPSDADRYDELVSSIRSAPFEQRFSMSSELEQIKNRHGGKPPVRVTDESGKAVAESLGLRWEGVQEWPGVGKLFGFTYINENSPANGDTFYLKPGATATDVRKRMEEKVAAYEPEATADQPAPKDTLDKWNEWADGVLSEDPRSGGSQMGLNPASEARRLAAWGVKGAVLIRNGVRDFAEWSKQMKDLYGDQISPYLNQLFTDAQERDKATNVLTPEAMTEIEAEFDAAQQPPAPPEAPPVIAPPKLDQKRAQVMGRPETGQLYTPSNRDETRAKVKSKVFDASTPPTPERTAAAWKLINDWSNPDTGLATAQGVLNAGGNTLAFGQAQQELFDYALELASAGNASMLNKLLDTINLMPTPGGESGMSEVARILSGRSDFDNPVWNSLKLVMDGRDQAVERKVGKKSAKAVKEAKQATDKVKPTAPEVEATVKKSNLQKLWEKWVSNITGRAQRTAEQMLNKYEQISSGAEWLKPGNRNRVRDIVKAAMASTEPILSDPSPWTNLLRDELIGAGVSKPIAGRLAQEVAGARQTAWANRRLQQMRRAAQSLSTASLTESIISAPQSDQNNPAWRKDTALRWFMSNGLSRDQAETAAKLYGDSFETALGNARAKVAEPILARGEVRNREDILRLIRAGPDWFNKLAEQAGWTGFTTDQIQRMAELDKELANPELDAHQTAKLNNELFSIVRKAKMPATVLQTIAEGFTASMFSGLRTFTINAFAPPFAMLRNYLTDISANPGNAAALTKAFKSSLKSALPEFKWAWMNNAFALQQNEYLEQSGALADMMSDGISDIRKGNNTSGAAKFVYGSQQYVLRWMGALDQAWRVAEKEYKTALYTSLAMKDAGYSKAGVDRLVDAVMATKQQAFEDALASGMSETDALVRANDLVNDAYYDALASLEDSKTAGTMREAARKDADAIVGFKSQDVSEQEEGMFSRLFMNRFMEFASGLFSSKNALERIGGRMAIGVVNVPYRTLRYFSNYSPYGLIRYAVHQNRIGKGRDTLWNQTFSNHLQARQRLNEAIAGTVLMAVMPLLASRTADDDDDNEFGIYVTGKGPEKTSDPIVRDAWLKKFKPFSITIKVGDKYASVPLGRTGEALLWPLALTGAFDDFAMKQKQQGGKKTPKNLDQTAEVVGSYFQSMFQRGLFSSLSKLGEFGGVRGGQPLRKVVESTAYSAGPLVPWKGAMQSLTRILSDPVDRSSLSGAILANSPIIGPMIGQPAINALGDPIMDQTVSGKMYGEGFPLVFRVSNPDHPAYRLIVKNGQGPATPQRSQVESVYGELTPTQWYSYNKEYGARLKLWMGQNYEALNKLNAEDFNERMTSYGQVARGRVVTKLGLSRQPANP